MSETTITSNDVAPVKVPKSFNDLNKTALVAAAEYFGSETEGNAAVIKADLLESGVTFEDYLAAFHPDVAVKAPEAESVLPEPVDVENWPDAEEGVNEVTETVVTVPPLLELAPQEKYLIKFTGENPYFERGRYKFTTDKPYAIMSAKDAQDALVEEPTKFRQAFPQELQEFYG